MGELVCAKFDEEKGSKRYRDLGISRGTHQDSHNLRRRLRPAATAAGIPWMTPHVLRHSLATELLDHGHDISAIAKILGHRSEVFTRRMYIHARETPRFDDLDI
jgi:integrase